MSTCGTGSHGGSFPVPGDPDLNNSVLSAVPFLNGIRVKWTYPATLDYAVAHAEVYRSTVGTTGSEIRIAKVSATFYDDLLDVNDDTQYFYWVRFISVNGTVGDLIGPVSATARPTVSTMLDKLTGAITSSQLSVDLNTPIGKVLGIEGDLAQEVLDRSAEIASYNAAIQQAIDDSAAAFNFASTIDSSYRTADLAVQARLDTFISGVSGEYATFEQQIITAAGENIDVSVAVQTELQAKIDDGTIASLTTVEQVVAGEFAKAVLKTEVDGLFGGYGIYNDGESVDVIFDVDRFAIGRKTGTDAVDEELNLFDTLSNLADVNDGHKVYITKYAEPTMASLAIDEVTVRIPNYEIPADYTWRAFLTSQPAQGGLPEYQFWTTLTGSGASTVVMTENGDYLEATLASSQLSSAFSSCYVVMAPVDAGNNPLGYMALYTTVSKHMASADGSGVLADLTIKPQIFTKSGTGKANQFWTQTIASAQDSLSWSWTITDVSPLKRLPFIVDNDEVFMDAAYIANLTTDKVSGLDADFVSANINNASITSVKIAGGAINNTHISNGTISGSKLSNSSITNSQIANSTITNSKIGSAAVDTLKIAGNAVTAVQYSAFNIDQWIYSYGTQRILCCTAYFNHGHTTTVPVLVRVNMVIDRHSGGSGSGTPVERWVYLRINSSTYVYPSNPVPKGNPSNHTIELSVNLGSGNNRIDVYGSHHTSPSGSATSGPEWQVQDVAVICQAVKR